MCFQLYSPVFQIKYYDEGAILITYKGERILMSNRKEIDIDSLSKSVMAYHNYRDEKTLNITGIGSIKSNGSDYILKVCGKKYLLKIKSSKNLYKDYVIINFKDGAVKTIFIIDEKIFLSYI